MRLLIPLLLIGCGEVTGKLPDAPPGSGEDAADAAPLGCGDGIRTPGEVCYKPPVTIQTGVAAYDAQFADMDSDGDLDVVFTGGAVIRTHINSNGVFAPTSIAGAATTGPWTLAKDFNNDQKVDVAVAGATAAGGHVVSMYRGDGTAHQTPAGAFNLGIEAMAIGSGDVMGSGEMLVTFDARSVRIYVISTDLGIDTVDSDVFALMATGAVGKVDADNFADLVAGGGNGVVLFRGGTGGLSPLIETPMVNPAVAVAIGDINGDAMGDIAYTQVDPTNGMALLGMLPGAGSGAFLEPVTMPITGASPGLQLADVDGDGKQDLIAGTGIRTGVRIDVLLGTATGFAAPVSLPLTADTDYLHTGDYNKDQAPDIIVTNAKLQRITIFESNP
ncbi:MAG: VCBS repeat-containing protein [Kofleriaceae bacterium]